jgi:hypothetical protein
MRRLMARLDLGDQRSAAGEREAFRLVELGDDRRNTLL